MQFYPLPQEFHTGHCFDAYRHLGAHPARWDEQDGWQFRIWAPGAARVQVVGDFSNWQGIDLSRDTAGVWSGFVPGAEKGQFYKFNVQGSNGRWQLHSDPYGVYTELRPGTASVLWDISGFAFDDDDWVRSRNPRYDTPLNIYELHAGSWMRHTDGSWYTWPELSQKLIPWLQQHHYNFIEFLPLAEHPFDGSWGYQITGYFSVTSRYGTPDQFAAFVNDCHRAGIGVLMDFVPVHFAVNPDGLAFLDGGPLYEYDSDVGQSEWGSCNFNVYRGEVCSFLCSAAAIWMDVYHCDGLRMDAVSRAIYWQGDTRRGINRGALEFLQNMNQGLHDRWPGVILAAEDSTTYLKVTAPVRYAGLGFDYKWDMGWMHDTLDYFSAPFTQRPSLYYNVTFSMSYFYNELYLLPFSHDEGVHGKHTILDKMWGSYEQKFDQARLLYFYMMVHPGKKLNFMGGEIGMFREWDEDRELDWGLLGYPLHKGLEQFIIRLGELYEERPELHCGEYHPGRFEWLVREAKDEGVFAFVRKGPDGRRLLAVLNTLPISRPEFPICLNGGCRAVPLLCTGSSRFGGTAPDPWPVEAAPGGVMGLSHTLRLDLEPLCGYLYVLE